MKWTDNIVMLLITVVSYVGEDANCTNDGNNAAPLDIFPQVYVLSVRFQFFPIIEILKFYTLNFK